MPGMSRDKCGAANIAGFVKTVSLLKPKGLHVIAELGFVRNSVGSDSFVADEIIMFVICFCFYFSLLIFMFF